MDHPPEPQSTNQAQGPSRDLDDDELQFQQDLRRAIEASRADSVTPAKPELTITRAVDEVETSLSSMPSTSWQSRTSTPSGSFLSDRAQMERERLARQKRHYGEDHESTSLPIKRQRSSDSRTDERSSTLVSSSSVSSSSSGTSISEDKPQGKAPNAKIPVVDQVFWDGELRPTANLRSEPRQDGKPTFRLSEVLGPVSYATAFAPWLTQGINNFSQELANLVRDPFIVLHLGILDIRIF